MILVYQLLYLIVKFAPFESEKAKYLRILVTLSIYEKSCKEVIVFLKL